MRGRVTLDQRQYRVGIDTAILPPVTVLVCEACSDVYRAHEVDSWDGQAPSLHDLKRAAERHELERHR